MPRVTTSDAKACLQFFFAFLEQQFKTRVRSKKGKTAQEWGQLATLASALSEHASKPRTPLITSSRARNKDNGGVVVITMAQKQRLRDVFIFYSSWGEKQNCMALKRSQFLQLARGTGLLSSQKLDSVSITALFTKMADHPPASPDTGVLPRMSMASWLQSLTLLGSKMFGHLEAQEAFDKLVEDHMMTHDNSRIRTDDPLAEVVLGEEVLECMDRARSALLPVFEHYSAHDQDPAETSRSTTSAAAGASWGETAAPRAQLPQEGFIRFCHDFDITPGLLTKLQLHIAVKACKFMPCKEGGKESVKISFQEYLDAVARCALMAYNFQVPAPPPPVLAFTHSYTSDAKRLWLNEAGKQHLVQDRDCPQLFMPSAASEYASSIGSSDQRHVTARGQHPISMSMLQLHSKTEDGNDSTECLQVHGDALTLSKEGQPLHLMSFSPSWVGSPGLALNEESRLRPSRQPTRSPDHLPPIYQQRAESWINARVVREQAVESLRLQYQAERRLQQRQHDMDTIVRRSSCRPPPASQTPTGEQHTAAPHCMTRMRTHTRMGGRWQEQER
ncbi:MAG: hypothetical protein WDW38_004235 [Sanguina aurantia]